MNSQRDNIVWKLIAQMVLLLVLYAAASLMTAVKFLATDPLTVSLPFQQISSVSHILLDLAILTGLIAVALRYALNSDFALLIWAFRGWSLLVFLTVLASLVGAVEYRHMLELPFLLDILLIAMLIFWLVLIFQDATKSEAGIVFLIGMVFVIVAFAMSLMPSSNPAQDRLLRVVLVNSRFFVGYGLCAVATISWLKRGEVSAFFSGGILLVVGTLASLIPLISIAAVNLPAIITFPIILIGFLVLAQKMMVQGQVWLNTSLAILLSGMGLIAAILAIPAVGQFALGTHLGNLPLDLMAWSVVLILLGTLKHWLEGTLTARGLVTANKFIIVTVLASNTVFLLVGVAQVFMERVLSVGYLDTQTTLIPLYMLWIVSHMLWGMGIVFYTNRYLSSGNHLLDVST